MTFSVSKAASKQAMGSHSWLGLLVAVFMYWVCLSGTLAVLAPDLTRWEQPQIAPGVSYDPVMLQKAYEQLLSEHDSFTGLVTMRLPTPDVPKAYLSANGQAWFITEQGTLSTPKSHPVTDFIAELHAELHLPHSIGELVVSVLGVMLTGLIISGIVAHRRILKDAFRLRRQGNPVQSDADLHNRLSVWGLPFYLMIALTGAYFGLAGPLNKYYAEVLYEGDQMALFADVYGGVPAAPAYNGKLDLPEAFRQLHQQAPSAQPLFITFEKAGQDDQYLLMGARHHDKFIYSEQYRFDAMGNYLDKVGFAGGEPGQEAIFSVYRLHFGHFGGPLVLLVYIGLGFALTVITISGINLWLRKRHQTDVVNDYWVAVVWGTPVAFACAALLHWTGFVAVTGAFWAMLALLAVYSAIKRNPAQVRRQLVAASALTILLMAAVHWLRFDLAYTDPMAGFINVGWVVIALLLGGYWRSLAAVPVANRG